MTIRRRILLLQFVIGLALLLIAGVAYYGIASISSGLERVQWSHRQVAAALQLQAAANYYSEQVAEILLVGESQRADLEKSRSIISRLVNESWELARRESDSLASEQEREEERDELDRIGQVQAILQSSDRAVERALLLGRDGRRAEAVELFRNEIENRLDADLGRLIDAALADERLEAERVDLEASRLARRLLWLAFGTLAVTLLGVAALSRHLGRAIGDPLLALTEAAHAIEHGDLAHRVPPLPADEFGELAQRFNAMAQELETQRALAAGARARLEREVASRTEELAEANRRLVELDRQRVDFLMDVSHELRTPLTVLRGEAEVALRSSPAPDPASREVLTLIVSQANQMSRLIDDLLFLARSEADEVRFEFTHVGVADVVADAIADAAVIARTRRVQMASSPVPPGLMVRADSRRLKQVLMIVLDNAIKYGPRDGRVEVAVSRDGGHVEVAVDNYGGRLGADELANAFDRHFRGGNARAQGVEGSGLGLTIARRIVQKHGGALTLVQTPDLRTRATLRLPVAEAA